MAEVAEKLRFIAILVVMMMVVVMVTAQEADAPSPAMITGAASMAVMPSLAVGLMGSLIAYMACLFH
ncbi:hypothetical protein SUGI_0015840 [Cryptomeria japonica]|nr:hypothetical protein SUGI_0015840 [Cryptomeria japonica]